MLWLTFDSSCRYFGNLCRNWGGLEEGKSTRSSSSFMAILNAFIYSDYDKLERLM